ncbi:hypothetical protein ACOSQ2_028932 [Xanthoceras sorbifolium]
MRNDRFSKANRNSPEVSKGEAVKETVVEPTIGQHQEVDLGPNVAEGQVIEGGKYGFEAESHLVEKDQGSGSFSSATEGLGSDSGLAVSVEALGSVVGFVVVDKGAVEGAGLVFTVSSGEHSVVQFRDGVVDREEVCSPKVKKWKRLARSKAGVLSSAGVFSGLRPSAAASIPCSVVSGAAVASGAIFAASNHAASVSSSGVDASGAAFYASRAAAWRGDPVPFPAGCVGPAGSAGGSDAAAFPGSAGNYGVAFLAGRAAACRAVLALAAAGNGVVFPAGCGGPAGVSSTASRFFPATSGGSAAQFFSSGAAVSTVAAGGSVAQIFTGGATVSPIAAGGFGAAFLASRAGSTLAAAGNGGT